MKVLICIPCLLTGGTEVQTLSLAKALLTSGHEVTTVCYYEFAQEMVKQYEEAGCKVICLQPEGKRINGIRGIWFLFRGLRHTVKTIKPDIAHVQYMAPGAIPIVLLRLLGVRKVIATTHTMADIYPNLRLVHFVQRHLVLAFTCITKKAEESFFGTSTLYTCKLALGKRNHFTIYNTLPSYISVINSNRHFNTPITIGVVSRLEYIKGMDMVVPAFAEAHTRYPETSLLIVGDGNLQKYMKQQVIDAELSDSVTFVGRQQNTSLQSLYDKIDILLVPSRSEGFGLTALEGMARGCVIVAANIGGLPEVLVDGEAGLLHRSSSTGQLSDRIVNLLSDTELMKKLSRQAVIRAKDFSFNTYLMAISNFYSKLEQ